MKRIKIKIVQIEPTPCEYEGIVKVGAYGTPSAVQNADGAMIGTIVRATPVKTGYWTVEGSGYAFQLHSLHLVQAPPIKAKRLRKGEERVGKAYRGPDGSIRWITGMSTRNYYQLLWLDEQTNIWHWGGRATVRDWEKFYDGPEVPAPKLGESYQRMGVLGHVGTMIYQLQED